MTKRKFHRYVYRFEVLSEEPLSDMDLADLAYATDQGTCSGRFLDEEHTEIDGKTCAEALLAQGSDPGFFTLDDEGNDCGDNWGDDEGKDYDMPLEFGEE